MTEKRSNNLEAQGQQRDALVLATVDNTRGILNSAKTLSKKFLQRTYYTHNGAMLITESVLIVLGGLFGGKKIGGLPVIVGSKVLFNIGKVRGVDALIKKSRGGIPVGEHMDISKMRYRAFTSKRLEDGTVVHPGDIIGNIDFDRGIPTLKPEENLVTFTKKLYSSVEKSLQELARLCETNDPRFEGIDVFYGLSMLASGHQAKKLGFDIFETSRIKRFIAESEGKDIIRRITSKNEEWQQRYKNSFRVPKDAFMSRATLIRLYGSQRQDVAI